MSTVVLVTATIAMTVTGYTACDEGMRCDGITASGMLAQEGICACGLSYDFGTLYSIPWLDKNFICMDRGSGIDNDRLDLYFKARKDALLFGVRVGLVEAWWWEVKERDAPAIQAPSTQRNSDLGAIPGSVRRYVPVL